ncbi:MAG: alpha/beta hydrolase [Myxococcales bacterium]|nr:alpha/beta hydrolase [Myxococcales bacterium]
MAFAVATDRLGCVVGLIAALMGCATHATHDASADADAADGAVADGRTCAPYDGAAPIPPSLPRCSPALPSAPSPTTTMTLAGGVTLHRNIAIAMRGGVSLEADLYLPPALPDARPGLLVLVHGGGWVDCMNRRDTLAPYGELLARMHRIAALNVEYRLTQEGGAYPENVRDVVCAVQWAHAHARDFNLDDRVGIVGTSAGAHLALMAGLIGGRADIDPRCGTDASVAVTVAWAAPTDLPSFVRSSSMARAVPPLYTGESCDEAVTGCAGSAPACARCVDASPIAHACSARSPVVLVQAPDPYDRLVPEAQARTMAAALRAAGASVTLLVPTDSEMRAHGCTPEGGSHALDGCTLRATASVIDPLLGQIVGPSRR